MVDVLGRNGSRLVAGLAVMAGLTGAALLSGCEDGGDDVDQVDAVEAAALDTVDGVLHDIATTVGMEFGGGQHFFNTCGAQVAPSGVRHHVTLNFTSTTELTPDAATERTAALLEDAGWSVEKSGPPPIVVGTRDGTTVHVQLGGTVVVDIDSECVDTSADVAREYDDRKAVPIDWA